jgi:hypothetical protein
MPPLVAETADEQAITNRETRVAREDLAGCSRLGLGRQQRDAPPGQPLPQPIELLDQPRLGRPPQLGISKDWLYRHASELPFALRIGRRLVFDSAALERWNRRHAER